MCSDYADTLAALKRWLASSGKNKAARIEEYQELARALETEILTALRLPTGKAPTGDQNHRTPRSLDRS
jgi:hypothetical protein